MVRTLLYMVAHIKLCSTISDPKVLYILQRAPLCYYLLPLYYHSVRMYVYGFYIKVLAIEALASIICWFLRVSRGTLAWFLSHLWIWGSPRDIGYITPTLF
jgi:hypothetical protein